MQPRLDRRTIKGISCWHREDCHRADKVGIHVTDNGFFGEGGLLRCEFCTRQGSLKLSLANLFRIAVLATLMS